MGGKKVNSALKPSAFGVMVSQSVYGQAIANIYGTMRGSIQMIWSNDLRKGDSGKKAKKKHGPPTYVEGADWLIGSNPILSDLRGWFNNVYEGLNFVKWTGVAVDTGWDQASLTVPDSKLYCVLAVTVDVTLSGTFNDYGGPGAIPYSGTYELPLWNAWFGGPDLTNPSSIRRFPYSYFWAPHSGAVIDVSQVWANLVYLGNFHVYYAQLRDKGVAIARMRLHWENQLGNGSEYGLFPTQQIIYPYYAGVGSSDIDLGAVQIPPNLTLEIAGSYGSNPPYGDADYADIIEDIFKSGTLALETQLGEIQRGLNCCELPGMVQQNRVSVLEPSSPPVPFYRPNKAGAILIAGAIFRQIGGGSPGVPSISDLGGNTWTAIVSGDQYAVWKCPSANAYTGNVATFASSAGNQYDADCFIAEMDPDSDVIGTPATASGTGGSANVSITVTGPCFILGIAFITDRTVDLGTASAPHWDTAFEPSGGSFIDGGVRIFKRYVAGAGTYSFSVPVNPSDTWTAVAIPISSQDPVSYPKPLGDILDDTTMQLCRLQAKAYGLMGSLWMAAQQKASDYLADLYQAMNARPLWSGFKLKSVPMSEVSAVGNGAVYIAPTASGPVADLDADVDMIGEGSDSPLTVPRKPPVDRTDILQMQFPLRDNNYTDVTISEPEPSGIAFYGSRKASPKSLTCVQETAVARALLAVAVRRYVYLSNIPYKFKLHSIWQLLEPGALVTVTDNDLGIKKLPVILTAVDENEQFELECEAEPFRYGMNAPTELPITTTAPNITDVDAVPASVNPPIFFEGVPGLAGLAAQLFIAVSDSDPDYGGCVVSISTDGGASYQTVGEIIDSAITGILTADWPAHADPDSSDDLPVDLTESLGSLASYQTSDEDNFLYPCYVAGGNSPPAAPSLSQSSGGSLAAQACYVKLTYVDASGETLPSNESNLAVGANELLNVASPASATGMTGYNVYVGTSSGAETKQNSSPIAIGTPWVEPTSGLIAGAALPTLDTSATIPYELMTYAMATLTAANKYTLKATGAGNHLRRAVFGAPGSSGVDHAAGSRFVFLGPSQARPGILQMALAAKLIGVQIFFKFQAFNQFGGGLQDISAATVYSFTPTGLPGGIELVQINGS